MRINEILKEGRVEYSSRPNDMQSRPYAIDPKLMDILERAAEAVDVDVKITSGGQDTVDVKGGHRHNNTSTRHDLGQAADVQIYKNNQRQRSDSDIAKDFIRQCGMHGAKEVGYGYMGNYSIHIGLKGVDHVNTQGQTPNSQAWGSDDARDQGLDALQRGITDRWGGGGYT